MSDMDISARVATCAVLGNPVRTTYVKSTPQCDPLLDYCQTADASKPGYYCTRYSSSFDTADEINTCCTSSIAKYADCLKRFNQSCKSFLSDTDVSASVGTCAALGLPVKTKYIKSAPLCSALMNYCQTATSSKA
eukprot:CAMPEP_0184690084 /NCGR_PEP_ID=MMETSP0312-20130426/31020_1 /TAXON_ID=31354 /ORGANISM="Compsopogon coeruleus, Strain SAG 36.94" /LENGTH=134 /DNA_ID=CAMNT_0027147517 /DNA_START=3521 /DNA_END=3921 /DNA_ORIENTATION=+